MESHLRSLVKSISFRIVAILGTLAVTWALTRDIEETTWITLAVHLFLTALYFANERLWNRIDWGRARPEAPEDSADDSSTSKSEQQGAGLPH